jgi:hypothetical protein
MNNPDHISESLETLFGLKYLISLIWIREGKNFEPGWKKFGSVIRDKHPGSATHIFVVLKFLRSLIFKHKKATLPQLRDLATNANFFTQRDESYLQKCQNVGRQIWTFSY